jgi:hypothetical protein
MNEQFASKRKAGVDPIIGKPRRLWKALLLVALTAVVSYVAGRRQWVGDGISCRVLGGDNVTPGETVTFELSNSSETAVLVGIGEVESRSGVAWKHQEGHGRVVAGIPPRGNRQFVFSAPEDCQAWRLQLVYVRPRNWLWTAFAQFTAPLVGPWPKPIQTMITPEIQVHQPSRNGLGRAFAAVQSDCNRG